MYTFFNFLVSTLAIPLLLIFVLSSTFAEEIHKENASTFINALLSGSSDLITGGELFAFILLFWTIVLFVFASFNTLLFLFFDYLCCFCCDCFLGATEWTVFDPENQEANLERWGDGKIHDMDKEEEENIVKEKERKLSNRTRTIISIVIILIIIVLFVTFGSIGSKNHKQ